MWFRSERSVENVLAGGRLVQPARTPHTCGESEVAAVAVTPLEIAQLWRRVHREMRALFRATVRDERLPFLAFPLLRHIQDEPGLTLSELARRTESAKSHMSTVVEQLVQEGFIEKRSDPADQRVLNLYLTDQAERHLEEMERRAGEAWALVLEAFPEYGPDDVARFLSMLLAALERANARVRSQAASEAAVEVTNP